MGVRRIATSRGGGRGFVAIVVTHRGAYRLTPADILIHDTPAKMKTELLKQAQAKGDTLPDLFMHQNRDGSIAMAIGIEPDIWPEDDLGDALKTRA